MANRNLPSIDPKKDNKTKLPTARLTMVVEWGHDDDMPTPGEVEEIIDKAREYAYVKSAKFETFQLICKELV